MKCEVRIFVTGMSRVFALVGEKTVLVDTGAKGDEATLARGVERIGVQPDQVSLFVLTHAHSDHTAPMPALRRLIGDGDEVRPGKAAIGPVLQ